MKIEKHVKLFLLGLITFVLISACMPNKNNMEKEVQKLFNGLPVQKGIKSIIKSSKYKFEYYETINIMGRIQTWITEIDTLEYLHSPTKRIILELGQNSEEEEIGCYNTSLRLIYEDQETMEEEYYKIKEAFELLGEKVDTETEIA